MFFFYFITLVTKIKRTTINRKSEKDMMAVKIINTTDQPDQSTIQPKPSWLRGHKKKNKRLSLTQRKEV